MIPVINCQRRRKSGPPGRRKTVPPLRWADCGWAVAGAICGGTPALARGEIVAPEPIVSFGIGRGRPGDAERRPAQGTDDDADDDAADDAADDAGDEPGEQRRAAGQGDAQTQRNGNEEHDDSRREIVTHLSSELDHGYLAWLVFAPKSGDWWTSGRTPGGFRHPACRLALDHRDELAQRTVRLERVP